MSRRTNVIGVPLAVLFLLIAASWSTHGQEADPQMESAYVKALPDGPGKVALVRMCNGCHGVDEIGVARLSRKGWAGKVDEMFRVGATGTDRDVALVVDYLFTLFPARLDINKAITMDFRRYLSLSEKEGDMIVAYRQQHGPFKKWQDLELVPGIDLKKVRERSEILFVD
jgi:hypothetical protein